MREEFLVSDDPSTIIDKAINGFDDSAIKILRVVESQRHLVNKCKQLWDQYMVEGSQKLSETLPGISEISPLLTATKSNLNSIRDSIFNLIMEKSENEKYISLQYKSKLIELLNKY